MAAVLLLLGIGVATILSATYSGRNSGLEVKQVYWILIGLVALLVCVSVDYRRLVDHAPLLYLLSVGVLAYVLFLGPRIAGTRRWLVMGRGNETRILLNRQQIPDGGCSVSRWIPCRTRTNAAALQAVPWSANETAGIAAG